MATEIVKTSEQRLDTEIQEMNIRVSENGWTSMGIFLGGMITLFVWSSAPNESARLVLGSAGITELVTAGVLVLRLGYLGLNLNRLSKIKGDKAEEK